MAADPANNPLSAAMKSVLLSLPRTVLVLGGVSFLNDAASDMLAPLLPLFLTATLGAGPMVVGLIEGVAEATASILKLVAGWRIAVGIRRGWCSVVTACPTSPGP